MPVNNHDIPQSLNRWLLLGAKNVFSIPALILMVSFVGFGSFARENGIGLFETMLMTGSIWALPAQVILTENIAANTGVLTAAVAVGLSSIRLMPMVMALLPEIQNDRHRGIHYFVVISCVAITIWVFAMHRIKDIPRHARISYLAGFAGSLWICNVLITGIAHQLSGLVPPIIATALLFLMPLYFLITLPGAARGDADKFAFIFGVALGPALFIYFPDYSLILTGLIGGTLAFIVTRFRRKST
ncbi:MAG: AzlC family ABC transporter permease [Cohaesibacteraceae bacterium]|nr:AzlC family ABC transporter permease [Cohaesibacteraceae bacterium]